MSSNLNAKSFHDAALESKLDDFENARDSMDDLRGLGAPGPSSLSSASAAFRFQKSDKSAN